MSNEIWDDISSRTVHPAVIVATWLHFWGCPKPLNCSSVDGYSSLNILRASAEVLAAANKLK